MASPFVVDGTRMGEHRFLTHLEPWLMLQDDDFPDLVEHGTIAGSKDHARP